MAGADRGGRTAAWLLKLAVGLLLFVVAFRDVSLDAVGASLRGVAPVWLAAGVCSALLTVVCVAMRWRTLIGHRVGARGSFLLVAAILASQAANVVMPFKLGDAVRIGAVSRALHLPPAQVLGSVAVERLFEGLLIALAAGGLAVSRSLPGFAHRGAISLAVSLAIALIAVASAVHFHASIARVLGRTAMLPAAASRWIVRQSELLLAGLRPVAAPGVAATAFAWSAAVTMGSVLTASLVLRACDIDAPATAAVAVVIAVQIGSVVVPVPGGLGISQVITVQTLRLWGVPEAPALAYALVLFLVSRVPKIALLPLALPLLTRASMERP